MTQPNLPQLLDAHHHLWDTDVLDYSLMDGPLQAVKGRYDAAAFDDMAASHGIKASICVEAASAGADPRSETSWLLAQAAKSKVVRGVVVWAPLGTGDAARYLDGVLEQAGAMVKGVRRSFELSPPEALTTSSLGADLAAAGERGLSVDLVLFEGLLPQAFELAKSAGDVRFVLDHLGKPRVTELAMEPWRKWMKALGGLDNVVCKISGLAVEAHDPNWAARDLFPYLEVALECFGWQRVLFGTDWPVCDLAGGVGRWSEAVNMWTASCSALERSRLFWDNAASFWRLEEAVIAP